MEKTTNTVLQSLHALLEKEAQFLKAGHAHKVVALSQEKLKLLSKLEASATKTRSAARSNLLEKQVKAVVRLAKENAEHFQAVSNGLGGLIQRMEALQGDTSVGAYSDAGGHMSFQRSHGNYFKKL